MKERLDVILVEQGYAPSREKAKAIIMSGNVYVNGQKEDKAGTGFDVSKIKLEVRNHTMKYVSRGGLKLEKAMQVFPMRPDGKVCMDIGASTGGFTDCLLKRGAATVVSVDVGRAQFDWSLRQDDRVMLHERTNVTQLPELGYAGAIDLAVCDVSFTSISNIIDAVLACLAPTGAFCTLVKPQFEAGRGRVGKNGVVRDKDTHRQVVEDTARFALDTGFSIRQIDYSPITGPKGNIEFLLLLEKSGTAGGTEVLADIPHIVDMAHGELA